MHNPQENDAPINPDNSPQCQAYQGGGQTNADTHPKPINWRKVKKAAAFFGIIEVVALVLWQEADEFNGITGELIHWISKCGFLAGGAFLAHKNSKCPKLVWIVFGIFCLTMLAVPFLKPAPEDRFSGELQPARDPFPMVLGKPFEETSAAMFTNSCTFLFAGGGVIGVFGKSTNSIVQFNEESLLSISHKGKNAFVSGEFFDKNGKIVAVLENNHFIADQQNVFRILRPDKSTLIIRDQYNVELLNIKFLNRDAFSLTAILYLPDGRKLEIDKTEIRYGDQRFISPFDMGSRIGFLFIGTPRN